VALFLGEPGDEAGFGTLAEVTALFTDRWAVLAGWLHYLAFDFLVGCWILQKARDEGIAHAWVVVPLVLTFLLGPLGWMLFLAVVFLHRRRRGAQSS